VATLAERRPVGEAGTVVDFASTLGYELLPSSGKNCTAVRTIDLDSGGW
jgi:hypothetical protein